MRIPGKTLSREIHILGAGPCPQKATKVGTFGWFKPTNPLCHPRHHLIRKATIMLIMGLLLIIYCSDELWTWILLVGRTKSGNRTETCFCFLTFLKKILLPSFHQESICSLHPIFTILPNIIYQQPSTKRPQYMVSQAIVVYLWQVIDVWQHYWLHCGLFVVNILYWRVIGLWYQAVH